nr:hypothetical protein [uncultured bacterium]
MKYSSLQTEDVKIMEQDVFMDQNLTFLRSGSPYHLNVSELAESIKVNGKLLSIKFHKDKFEVVFALKSEKDIEKI